MSRNGTGTFGPRPPEYSVHWIHDMRSHKYINSVLVLLIDRDRNSCPKIGMSPMPGTLLSRVVARRSRSPAIPNDCPSFSSISVSARRVEIAGTVKPESVKALLKSSALTSGTTCSRILLSSATVAVKVQLYTEGLENNRDGWRTRCTLNNWKGNSPPARKVAF